MLWFHSSLLSTHYRALSLSHLLGSNARNFKNSKIRKYENALYIRCDPTLWWNFCWINSIERGVGSLEGVECRGQRNVGSRDIVTSFISFAQQVWSDSIVCFSSSLIDALITRGCLWFTSLTIAFIRLNIKWEHQAASQKKRWSTCRSTQSSAGLQSSMVSHLLSIRRGLRIYQ